MGSLFFATPALAEDTAPATEQQDQAPAAEQVAEAPQQEAPAAAGATGAAPAEALSDADRQAIDSAEAFEAKTGGEAVGSARTPAGELVLLANEETKNEKVEDFAEATDAGETAFDKVLYTQPIIAYANTDVVGGAGYLADGAYFCSVGFPAFSPTGDPALLTAGHCVKDGELQSTELVRPSVQPAVTGQDSAEAGESNGTGTLGDFGSWRFGGPGAGNVGEEDDPESTDVAVIENLGSQFDLLPAVTDWESALSDDLSQSTIPVKSVGDPVEGAVAKSGRTTGYTQGDTTVTIDGQDYTLLDTWIRVDGRWVHGFLNDAGAAPGDSGGAVIQGSTAVGVVSGGPEDGSWMFATRLQDALELSDFAGYEVALDIDAPTVTSPANGATVKPGSDIVVSVPSNAKELSVSRGSAGETIPVSGGTVTLKAPQAPGAASFTLTAKNGFSTSESTTLDIEVEFAAPTIDELNIPANSADGTTVTLTGTGAPGATVEVELADEPVGTATVAEDGTWSLALEDPLPIGSYEVTAVQILNEEVSETGTGTVTVSPAAPKVTSFADGEVFELDAAPTTISGTGIDGATVTVNVDGPASEAAVAALAAQLVAATVEGGEWTVALPEALSAGSYTVTVTQAINEIDSAPTTVSFAVNAAATPGDPGGSAGAGGGADGAGNGTGGAGNGTGGGDNAAGSLPVTGDASLLPFGLAAGAALLLCTGVTLLVARRQRAAQL